MLLPPVRLHTQCLNNSWNEYSPSLAISVFLSIPGYPKSTLTCFSVSPSLPHPLVRIAFPALTGNAGASGGLHDEGVHSHPYLTKPHALMSEMMERHDDYYEKHFVSPKKKSDSKKTERPKKTDGKFEGYLIQEPRQTSNHFSFNFGDRIF